MSKMRSRLVRQLPAMLGAAAVAFAVGCAGRAERGGDALSWPLAVLLHTVAIYAGSNDPQRDRYFVDYPEVVRR